MTTLKIATYNIHKGFSSFNRRFVLHELRDSLRQLDADIVFLQEVSGASDRMPVGSPQHEFIAQDVWRHHAYGKNAVYDTGHHGNAIVSRLAIIKSENNDISAHRFEQRGVLHCEVLWPKSTSPLHCLCVHLGLFAQGRRVQFGALIEYIQRVVPAHAPLIIAGDFNDWRNHAQALLVRELGLIEAFEAHKGRVARSFPAHFPVLRLDRIYLRGLSVSHAEIHSAPPWSRISDHAALSAHVCLP